MYFQHAVGMGQLHQGGDALVKANQYQPPLLAGEMFMQLQHGAEPGGIHVTAAGKIQNNNRRGGLLCRAAKVGNMRDQQRALKGNNCNLRLRARLDFNF